MLTASGRRGRRRGDPASAPHHPRPPLRGLGRPRFSSRLHLTDRPTHFFSCPLAPAPRAVPAGVESFDVNLETQKVMVKGTVTQEEVIERIAKTGKAVEPWSD